MSNATAIWKTEEELILREWADKAQCYHWMHMKTHQKYKRLNIYFMVPIAIVPTISGSTLFISSIFGSYEQLVTILVGILSIIISIVTSIYQALSIAEKAEPHRVSSLDWNRFHENIKGVLMKRSGDRENPRDVMNVFSQEYYHLITTCPEIPTDVIEQCRIIKESETTHPVESNLCDTFSGTRIYNAFGVGPIEGSKIFTELMKKKANDNEITEMLRGRGSPTERRLSRSDPTPSSPLSPALRVGVRQAWQDLRGSIITGGDPSRRDITAGDRSLRDITGGDPSRRGTDVIRETSLNDGLS